MSTVRLLVGTRKGGFILTSNDKRQNWQVSGPHFPGWEIYHMQASPVNPERLYASQTCGWFGQAIQRSDDGGQTWQPVGNKFEYEGGPPPWSGTGSGRASYSTSITPSNATRPLPNAASVISACPSCSAAG